MSENLPDQNVNENWIVQFLISHKYRVYRHLLMILFFCLAMYNSPPEYIEPVETISQLIVLLLLLLLVYSNMYFLVPKFLLKNEYLKYGLFVLL